MNKNTYIKIFEFGQKNLDGFNYEKIIDEIITLEDWEKIIIEENMKNAFYNRRTVGAPGYIGKESFFYCINHSGGNDGLDQNKKYRFKG